MKNCLMSEIVETISEMELFWTGVIGQLQLSPNTNSPQSSRVVIYWYHLFSANAFLCFCFFVFFCV